MTFPKLKPFLQWAGGKSRLIPKLSQYIPESFSIYWEPFLGAGSMFFSIQPKSAVLSDINQELIDAYLAIKQSPLALYKYFKFHEEQNSEDYYYSIRTWYNTSNKKFSFKRAACFIFLNKASFNGIWRVNKNGSFNVPYNYKKNINFPEKRFLLTISDSLKNAKIICMDFREILEKPMKDDFVYLDPPYPPLNGTSNFTHYTKNRFNAIDQSDLARLVKSLHERKAFFLMSNADIPLVRELYRDFEIIELNVVRWIKSDGKRYIAKEVIIKNY